MSDVIDFLEKLGQDSALRHATGAQLEGALADARLSPPIRIALANRDTAALAALLSSANVCCLTHVPLEEQEEESPPERVAATRGNGGIVCCMIYAPLEEQEEPLPGRAAA